ncbi:MAG: pyruvate:ferredoxin (flavodoxin) oxidoreductase [Roseburia sp.]
MERFKKTMDGNSAAAYVAYAFTEVAAIYPITPSTTIAELVEEWSASGIKNIFDEKVEVVEMQSEAGASAAIHGALITGALASTYTASQGLLLMIPNLYKMAGEHLPGVIYVSARSIATHALSIFGDHSDIYACRQTGVAMLCEASVQEIMDLAPVAHLAALEGRIPFINFFDGFRTSHEIQKIECWDYQELKEMINQEALDGFRQNALNSEHPSEMGSAQNPDVFFQVREASNPDYERLTQIVEHYMEIINQKLGTNYHLFDYYGGKDAKTIIVAMGSVCETIEETIDYLNKKEEKVGLVKVRLYRPFSREAFLKALPDSVERIIVLNRTKEPGALGEPLYLDVLAAVKGSCYEKAELFSGRYGLGSKEITPGMISSIFHNQKKEHFTIGIKDDVTELSLPIGEEPEFGEEEEKSCKFWGLGHDGTVGANKNTIKIIGDHTDMQVQAYFDYDSKKSGGITISHLRFGKEPIRSAYGIRKADFVACHLAPYLEKYEIVEDIKRGGIFLLNCAWNQAEIEKNLPAKVKRYLAEHEIEFYAIDAYGIAKQIGLGSKVNTILQSAFFSLTKLLPEEEVMEYMKEAAVKTYQKKGDLVVQMNLKAIEAGRSSYWKVEIPEEWKQIREEEKMEGEDVYRITCGIMESKERKWEEEREKFVTRIQIPSNSLKGNELPVSAFLEYRDGKTPSGTAAYEKRGVATEVPVWDYEKCIQCNQCSYVCPHAVIRPVVLAEGEVEQAPEGMRLKAMNGMEGYKYAITISTYDCTGCESCYHVCPAPGKALHMEPFEKQKKQQKYFDYAVRVPEKAEVLEKFKRETVKGSQFVQPLFEFSGACGGCGETPYAKLVTQLFGECLYIANATGCSSIWANSFPSTPYTCNGDGKGPAWANSLFEDAAEFGLGMLLTQRVARERLKHKLEILLKEMQAGKESNIFMAYQNWLETFFDSKANQTATKELVTCLEKEESAIAKDILKEKNYLAKKSQWIFGGDGWAYDIGYGGLDHILASGEDINVLVFDTEIYSNTGGQASKATHQGALARLATNGKKTKKKNLAGMAMTYENVYVAQVAMGADYQQCIKAFAEAEQYPGPSLIIAYAPCISHGIRKGMGEVQLEERLAVESGYWKIFRYHPTGGKEGKPVMIQDGKEPTQSRENLLEEFLRGENRFQGKRKTE